MQPNQDGPKLTILGVLVVTAVIAGCLYGAYYLFKARRAPVGAVTDTPNRQPTDQPGHTAQPATTVEIGIAYGTEKRAWLTHAVEEFAKTPSGRGIKVNLLPLGSLEGAQAVLKDDKRITVWAPASSLYTENFIAEAQLKFGKNPIAKTESLALTPMVFVFWQDRYDAFVAKYKTVSFKSIAEALSEKGGWDAIAQKPEWGVFKFGHTHPNQSNSGLMTLVLMGYDFFARDRGLAMKDILNVEFQKWLNPTQAAVSGLSNSTGNLMRDMILRGPSSYDCVMVYESNVIENLKNAEGRWGKLRVEYPKYNAWNDNPYYVLDLPWTTPEQRTAAEAFGQFLLSEPMQRHGLTVNGFRPGNVNVPILFEGSPFVQYESFGLRRDLTTIVQPPAADVIANMLQAWQRTR